MIVLADVKFKFTSYCHGYFKICLQLLWVKLTYVQNTGYCIVYHVR